MLLYSSVGWIHLSIGKPGRLLRWSLVELALTVSLFLAALAWGPAGIAGAWSISYGILLIPGFWYAGRPIGFGVPALIAATWRFGAAALVAGLATAAIIRGTLISASPAGAGAALEAIIIISTVFVALYVGTVIVLHRSLAPLHQLATLLHELAPPREATRPATEAVGRCQ